MVVVDYLGNNGKYRALRGYSDGNGDSGYTFTISKTNNTISVTPLGNVNVGHAAVYGIK